MDCIPKYKPVKRPRKNLLDPPPYCRTFKYKMSAKHHCVPVKIEASDPAKLLAFIQSLNDTNSIGLERKLNRYIQTETESQMCFMITIIQREATVQVVGPDKVEKRKFKLSQAAAEQFEEECRPWYTLKELDSAYQKIIVGIVGTDKVEVVALPIIGKTQTGTAVVLVVIVNPKKDTPYCVQLIAETFKFSLALLLNTTTSEEESKARLECQTLLKVAKKLFQHLGDLGELLREIMIAARNLVNAERCSLFLIDEYGENLVAKVFDGGSDAVDVKISKHKGIAGHVYRTGEMMNISDAYTHPLFYKKLDADTGFKTKNILCFPIRDEKGIIGVAQLCNKKEGDFTFEDQEAAMAFSVYCGLAIMHTLVYKRIHEAQVKTQLSNELMMYHMKIDEDTFKQYYYCTHRHKFKDFDGMDFIPRRVKLDLTPCYMYRMFENLGLIERFGIKKDLLVRFILYIMKGYRDTPYHNWTHAFSVAHFCYVIVTNFRMIEKSYISHLEALALMTACLGHDVDHRGTTNAFQLKIGSPLANLYSSEGSVMERHHLSQTICILNTQKCNFLECLDNQSYELCLDMIKDNILATDLANHFKIFSELEDFYELRFKKEEIKHRKLLLSLIMTCSDLSDQTKGFSIAKEIAQKVYDEFFHQGDLEKKMGNDPIPMMDREKASIPDLQIQFLEDVCIPAFSVLARLFPKGSHFLDVLTDTKLCWEASRGVFEKHALEGKRSYDVLMSPTLEEEVREALKRLAEAEAEQDDTRDEGEEDPYSFDQDPDEYLDQELEPDSAEKLNEKNARKCK